MPAMNYPLGLHKCTHEGGTPLLLKRKLKHREVKRLIPSHSEEVKELDLAPCLHPESPCSGNITGNGQQVDAIRKDALGPPGICHWVIPMVDQHEQMFGGKNMHVD